MFQFTKPLQLRTSKLNYPLFHSNYKIQHKYTEQEREGDEKKTHIENISYATFSFVPFSKAIHCTNIHFVFTMKCKYLF